MYASKELQADREVVLAAVQQDLIAVHFASPEVQADRELVLAVVRQAGLLLEYASKELQADREVRGGAASCAAEWLGAETCLPGAAGRSRGGAGGRAGAVGGWRISRCWRLCGRMAERSTIDSESCLARAALSFSWLI